MDERRIWWIIGILQVPIVGGMVVALAVDAWIGAALVGVAGLILAVLVRREWLKIRDKVAKR